VAIADEAHEAAPVPQAEHLVELTTEESVKNPNFKQSE